jgi:hypothetical protein
MSFVDDLFYITSGLTLLLAMTHLSNSLEQTVNWNPSLYRRQPGPRHFPVSDLLRGNYNTGDWGRVVVAPVTAGNKVQGLAWSLV